MTTTENSIRRTYLSRFGIYLLEMTITGNTVNDVSCRWDGIYLLEMTTTENGVRIRLANGIRYLPV